MRQSLMDKFDFMINTKPRLRQLGRGYHKGIIPRRKASEPPVLTASASEHTLDSAIDMTAPNSANSANIGADLFFSLPGESFGQSCIILRDGLKNMSRKMKRSRLVRKDGYCNVYQTNVSRKERQYIRDIFTTLIDAKWRWIIFFHTCAFFSSWMIFAVIYYITSYFHGDLDEAKLGNYRNNQFSQQPLTQKTTAANASKPSDSHEPCIANVHSFLAAFLFSVETEHTIGYGYRYVTTQCPSVWISVCIQSLSGLILQSLIVGLVFAKMARPKKRSETLMYSENAVISLRDGQLCFLFRVGDMRISHLVEAHVRVQMITKRTTMEGEVEPLYQYDMDVGFDDGSDRIFLVWPITICHVIDEASPLYHFSSRSLPTAQFEIIVLLEGIVESTGMTAQAKTSYLPSETLWGHRFEKLVTYQKCNGSYQIDYSLFHNTYPVNTPRCSAKELDRMKSAGVELSSSGLFFCKTQEEAELEESAAEGCSDSVTEIPAVVPRAECTTVKNLRRCSSTPHVLTPPRDYMRKCSVSGRWGRQETAGACPAQTTIDEDLADINENNSGSAPDQEPLLSSSYSPPQRSPTHGKEKPRASNYHGRHRHPRRTSLVLNPPLKPQQIVIHSPGSPPATLQERVMVTVAGTVTSGQAIQVKNDAVVENCVGNQVGSVFGEED